MKKQPVSIWIYKAIRYVLGAIFFYSGFIKLLDPQYFTVIIEAYGIVPEATILPIAIVLPVLEVLTGIGLLLDIQGALAVTFGLMLLFIGILSYGIWMGLDVDCGCFGPEDPEAEAFHSLKSSLYRNSVIVLSIFTLYYLRFSRGFKPIPLNKILLKLKGVLLWNK